MPETPDLNCEPAVFFLVDPVNGLAPGDVEACGLGPVLVARSDGEDFTVPEMWELHDYLLHLMEGWSEFTDKARRRALRPAAYHTFTDERRRQQGAHL